MDNPNIRNPSSVNNPGAVKQSNPSNVNNPYNPNTQNNKAQKHEEIVSKIMNMLRLKGPTLPVHVASETGLSTLFASAFLSELISRKAVKLSSMRIGSSPLYFLPGQEEQLMKFVEHIKGKERDAYDLIKERGILRDDDLEPAIRVALRSIRDFAFPIQANLDGKEIVFWRFLTLKDEDAKGRIRMILEPAARDAAKQATQRVLGYKKEEDAELSTGKTEEKEHATKKAAERTAEKKKDGEIGSEIFRKEEGRAAERAGRDAGKFGVEGEKKAERAQKIVQSDFLNNIKEKLRADNIEVVQEIEVKKKEGVLKVRVNSDFGRIEFLAICRDKKKVNEVDLAAALQKAHHEKLPCLFISPGELDKKATAYLSQWQNLLRFKRV